MFVPRPENASVRAPPPPECRVIRFLEQHDCHEWQPEWIAVLDPRKNLLLVNKELYSKLTSSEQDRVIKTHKIATVWSEIVV